jgi:Oxidoreductase family, NAD-binding Rossmann fold
VKALLIGCGNIGAMYDFEDDNVQTHAKMYYKNNIEVDIIEPDDFLAKRVSRRYNFNHKAYKDIDLSDYKYVSICTPTIHHFKYLSGCLKANVPIVICEKPISYSSVELNQLLTLNKVSETVVVVNYIRRFQPNYLWLKNQICEINEELTYVNCYYYKGLLNYASHAIDTVEFLTYVNILDCKISILDELLGHNEFDPSFSFSGSNTELSFNFIALNVKYPILELDLFFKTYRVSLTQNGDTITIYKNGEIESQKKNVLRDYMLPVFQYCESGDLEKKGNFVNWIDNNKKLIKIKE